MEQQNNNPTCTRTYNFNQQVGQFIEHVDTVYFSLDGDGKFHFSNASEVNVLQKNQFFVPVGLKFFDSKLFGSERGQSKLVAVLRETTALIDINSGTDWFCFYAAYRYYKNQLGTQKEYVSFFTDIEHLLPGLLANIMEQEQGDKRYHTYTVMLGREVQRWYRNNNSLPPLNDLNYGSWYGGSKEQFDNCRLIIKKVFLKFREIEAELKA
jgi:hypothetical protein